MDALIGDPHEIEGLSDSLNFEHKSMTAVIAWGSGDDRTDGQVCEGLQEVEKTAWDGLDTERYAWSSVQHRDWQNYKNDWSRAIPPGHGCCNWDIRPAWTPTCVGWQRSAYTIMP